MNVVKFHWIVSFKYIFLLNFTEILSHLSIYWMMDINKYILGQIKIDEKLLKMVEQQEKQPTKVIEYESKQ